jgi:hypothetical protein
MAGAQLARAVAQLCSARPDLDAKLKVVLVKWVKDNVAKGATLDSLRKTAKDGGSDVVRWHVAQLNATEVAKLTKKLDPHRPKSPRDTEPALKAHVLALVIDNHKPHEKPEATGPMPIDKVLALRDSAQRRIEFDRHRPAALKKAVKEHGIDAEQLGSKPSKTEIIEHIEAAIAAGWPRTQSITDTNKLNG